MTKINTNKVATVFKKSDGDYIAVLTDSGIYVDTIDLPAQGTVVRYPDPHEALSDRGSYELRFPKDGGTVEPRKRVNLSEYMRDAA